MKYMEMNMSRKKGQIYSAEKKNKNSVRVAKRRSNN